MKRNLAGFLPRNGDGANRLSVKKHRYPDDPSPAARTGRRFVIRLVRQYIGDADRLLLSDDAAGDLSVERWAHRIKRVKPLERLVVHSVMCSDVQQFTVIAEDIAKGASAQPDGIACNRGENGAGVGMRACKRPQHFSDRGSLRNRLLIGSLRLRQLARLWIAARCPYSSPRRFP